MKFLIITLFLIFSFAQYQKGIISDTREYAAYLTFRINQRITCKPILQELSKNTLQYGDYVLLGLGQSLKENCFDGNQFNIPTFNRYPMNIREMPQ